MISLRGFPGFTLCLKLRCPASPIALTATPHFGQILSGIINLEASLTFFQAFVKYKIRYPNSQAFSKLLRIACFCDFPDLSSQNPLHARTDDTFCFEEPVPDCVQVMDPEPVPPRQFPVVRVLPF